MPIVLRNGPYRIGFFSNENLEPPHVHVDRDYKQAKFWLTPMVRLEANSGFAGHELTRIRRIVEQYREILLEKWHEHHRR
ncbi:MAG: DUF4160 domain-containing protein [Tepidisphaeraceae bacterium]|jgi:hypothetical protein